MNDTELDEMLDQWSIAAPSARMRESVRAGFAVAQVPVASTTPVRRRFAFIPAVRRALLAVAILVAGVFLFDFAQALSQTSPPANIPFTVDSEFIRYGDDGSPTVEMVATSYNAPNGSEIVVSRSIPGRPFDSALGRILDAALPAWQRFVTPFAVSPDAIAKVRKKRSGEGPSLGVVTGCPDFVAWGYRREATCLSTLHWYFPRSATEACLDGPVVGSEAILNYQTTAVQRLIPNHRATLWMAPALGCFALRITTEEKRPDGSFRLVQTKQALKVTVSP